jgi:hypothetical protein
MATQSNEAPKQSEIVKIPEISSIAGRVRVHRDSGLGRLFFGGTGSLLVFVMAAVLPIVPLILLFLLLRQPDVGSSGLAWVWISMIVITEAIALLAAIGIVRSVIEGDM